MKTLFTVVYFLACLAFLILAVSGMLFLFPALDSLGRMAVGALIGWATGNVALAAYHPIHERLFGY